MKNSQKIKLLLKLSGLTQEKLANKLGVSFVTLNSWLNKRSEPRLKKIKEIDNLLARYTGEQVISEDVLQVKKKIIFNKRKKYKNIIKKIKSRSDVYKEFILSLTYNSNTIEGSTLTKNETADILFNNSSLKNRSLTEHLEAKNHQTALEFLFDKVDFKFKITENFILKLHSILMNGVHPQAGCYRNHGVRIVGANVPTANFLKISILMKDLIIKINKPEKDFFKTLAEVHSNFEKIHPFADGNGRIGRLIMISMLLKKNLPPVIIKQKNKRFYYKYLNKSQINNEHSLLEDFLCDGILDGFELLEKN